nr:YbaK/EbsC family protein [Gluconobacter wancherniae]
MEPIVSLESVRADLAIRAPELSLILTEDSTATVEEAAQVHGVVPDQIAKTLGVRLGSGEDARIVLVVMAGTKRLDNRKAREALGAKPRFLNGEEVLAETSHPPGGVCPFGLPSPIPVYCDISLQAFDMVIPAAGSLNASVMLSPAHLADLTGAEWVQVAQD